MNRIHICGWLAITLVLISCSSVPRNPKSQASEKARLFLEQGRREELKQNFPDALILYKDAEHNAIMSNEFDLQLISLQGEARIAFFKSDSADYQKIITNMKKLIKDVRPASEYRITQIDFWRAFQIGKYQDILDREIDTTKLPLNVRIEILSFLIQSKAKLKQTNDNEKALLKKAIIKYKLRLKRKDTLRPELLSNAYYSLAYSDAVVNNQTEALSWLSKAITLDRNYDLYIHLAEDYALAGKCERKKNNLIKAKADFVIAHQIFMETNQIDEAKEIKLLLDDIQVKD
jgi:tetratricopeptide (TPR) repeat protein